MLVVCAFFLCCVTSLASNAEATSLLDHYYQDDYDATLDIVDIAFYNRSHFRDLKAGMVLYNRTQRVFNGSAYLLLNLTKDIKLELQTYKFMSNEYRFFPITMKVNACDEYYRNTFELRTLLNKLSNIRGCPSPEGFYYIRNALPEVSKFPPHIPTGKYKMVMKWLHKNDFAIEGHLYLSVLDKPIKWSK